MSISSFFQDIFCHFHCLQDHKQKAKCENENELFLEDDTSADQNMSSIHLRPRFDSLKSV